MKSDANHIASLFFDVNSAYFDNHGGYEFAGSSTQDATKLPFKSWAVSSISSRQSCTPMRSTVP